VCLFITRFLVSGLPKLRIGPTTQQWFNKVTLRYVSLTGSCPTNTTVVFAVVRLILRKILVHTLQKCREWTGAGTFVVPGPVRSSFGPAGPGTMPEPDRTLLTTQIIMMTVRSKTVTQRSREDEVLVDRRSEWFNRPRLLRRWTAASSLHCLGTCTCDECSCSCLESCMHIACGSSVHSLQAQCQSHQRIITVQSAGRHTARLATCPTARFYLKLNMPVPRNQCPAILKAGRPLSRQSEILWQFHDISLAVRGTRHVKCYSYHAHTSVTVSGGGRNAIVHDLKPYI